MAKEETILEWWCLECGKVHENTDTNNTTPTVCCGVETVVNKTATDPSRKPAAYAIFTL